MSDRLPWRAYACFEEKTISESPDRHQGRGLDNQHANFIDRDTARLTARSLVFSTFETSPLRGRIMTKLSSTRRVLLHTFAALPTERLVESVADVVNMRTFGGSHSQSRIN